MSAWWKYACAKMRKTRRATDESRCSESGRMLTLQQRARRVSGQWRRRRLVDGEGTHRLSKYLSLLSSAAAPASVCIV